MRLLTAGLQTDGRPRGSYVYLLLCRAGSQIHIKAGRSSDPIKRMRALIVGCSVPPQVIAVASLPTFRASCRAEVALHRAFKRWHSHGEWFVFQSADREAFNRAWREALAEFGSPSWPIKWTKMAVEPILAEGRARLAGRRWHRQRRGRAFKDFQRDQG